jgi:hypothetical protein
MVANLTSVKVPVKVGALTGKRLFVTPGLPGRLFPPPIPTEEWREQDYLSTIIAPVKPTSHRQQYGSDGRNGIVFLAKTK